MSYRKTIIQIKSNKVKFVPHFVNIEIQRLILSKLQWMQLTFGHTTVGYDILHGEKGIN